MLELTDALPRADVLRVMPSKAIEFTAFDAYKKVLCKRDPVTGAYVPGHASSALAGGAAGVSAGWVAVTKCLTGGRVSPPLLV